MELEKIILNEVTKAGKTNQTLHILSHQLIPASSHLLWSLTWSTSGSQEAGKGYWGALGERGDYK